MGTVKYNKSYIMENPEKLEPIGEVKLSQVQPTYLLTINDNGEKLIEIDKTGNISYMKDHDSLTKASKVFWNSLQGDFFVIEKSLIKDTPNDMELGKLVRQAYHKKLDSFKIL